MCIRDRLTAGLNKAGFNKENPFPVDMAVSQYSNSGKKIKGEIQLADSGYGQGEILVNPIHLASMYSAFQNQGNMVKPHLEKGEKKSLWIKDVFSARAVKEINKALEQVIQNPQGTGHGAALSGKKLAGKTGTAEIKASQTDTSGTELGLSLIHI